MMRNALRRRRASAAVTMVTVAGLLLAGCSSGSSSGDTIKASSCAPSKGKVTLQYWNWVPGMDKVIDVWNKSHPNIQVEMKNISNNAPAQIQNALKANQAPDLAQVGYDSLPGLRTQNSLVDVSGCNNAVSAKANYVPWTWSLTSFNGTGIFGFPQDIGPMVLYYRADLFKQYGFAVPATWDEFVADAQKLKTTDPQVKMTYFQGTNAGWFNGLVWQKGGSPSTYAKNNWKVSIDSAQSQAVAGVWQKLIDQKLVRTDLVGSTPPLYNALSKNQVLSFVGAGWQYSNLRDNVPAQAGKWRVAPMPSWTAGDNRAGDWGGSAVAFMKGGKHPYEAVEFNNWLNSDPEALALENNLGGLFPAAKAGANLAAFKSGVPYYGNQKIFDVFSKAAANIDPSWQWGPVQQPADLALVDGFNKATGGNGTLTDALQASQNAAIKAMKEQGMPVATGQ